MPDPSPEPRFDPLIHAPHRLRISAMLSQAGGIEFSEIQRRTGLSKSALSKHLGQLAEAGYARQAPFLRAGRSRLLVSLTETGREAYTGHVAALEKILAASRDERGST
ncbi:transcriptional regulator [Nesterenkonia xinjiangensis]|uniref:DNA-binding MarR family transcriptional regulator n=1 Tax=Nesterenkonia xinjiangensis TaxID=225327 RepID=A0A7Z0GLK4_9MICC|nr:DNA-binding MarR family transcriptional regulator [Nesterenkonia xinjiangensis]